MNILITGGVGFADCSVLEAIVLCEQITNRKMKVSHSDKNRIGDNIWWISDTTKFRQHYPDWYWKYNLEDTLVQISNAMSDNQ